MSGKLWVVATPIGNLDDFSVRAVAVLRRVRLILAEDTRHSRLLLDHYQITTPTQAWHLFNEHRKLDAVLQRLLSGEELALISDAGTPLISDPGSLLVDACYRVGVVVSTVPGACAAIAGLSVSGIAADKFYFEGFLPAKSGERVKRLRQLADFPCTVVCYEAPHRLLASLRDMIQCLGNDRVITVIKELTKMHEQAVRAPLVQQVAYWSERPVKGEWVIVIEKVADQVGISDVLLTRQQEHLLRELLDRMPAKQAVKLVAELAGVRANELYRLYCGNNKQ